MRFMKIADDHYECFAGGLLVGFLHCSGGEWRFSPNMEAIDSIPIPGMKEIISFIEKLS